jgi:hypothetical protein
VVDVTTAVTLLAEVLNTNPVGIFKVTLPFFMSPLAPSVTVGPVSDVNGPPTVFEGMALPPLAGVTVAAAKTLLVAAKNKDTAMAAKRILLLP